MTIFEEADARLLPGFERRWIETAHGKVLALIGGAGPALLMLHGDPQTHLCWHRIAPKLTDRFTVVLTDIRGRGETHKPGHDAEQNAYSKRDMATEQLEVMRSLGHDKFALIAHDRGARVARRLALDHAAAVSQMGRDGHHPGTRLLRTFQRSDRPGLLLLLVPDTGLSCAGDPYRRRP